MLGSRIEENRGEELFVRGGRPEVFNAETRNVVMLSPGGPDRRFCDYARGVTVAFAFLKLPEDFRQPDQSSLHKACLHDV